MVSTQKAAAAIVTGRRYPEMGNLNLSCFRKFRLLRHNEPQGAANSAIGYRALFIAWIGVEFLLECP
jgi:hypothetical protein